MADGITVKSTEGVVCWGIALLTVSSWFSVNPPNLPTYQYWQRTSLGQVVCRKLEVKERKVPDFRHHPTPKVIHHIERIAAHVLSILYNANSCFRCINLGVGKPKKNSPEPIPIQTTCLCWAASYKQEGLPQYNLWANSAKYDAKALSLDQFNPRAVDCSESEVPCQSFD